MTTTRPATRETMAGSILATALLALVGTIVALFPFVDIIAPGPWISLTVVLVLLSTVTGTVTRLALRERSSTRQNATAMLVQLVIGVGIIILATMASTAVLGIIPTFDTLSAFTTLFQQASWEVMNGYAPLEDTLAVRTLFCTGFLVLIVLIDALLSLRLTVLAVVLIAAVGAAPTIITLSAPSLVWFAAFAITALLLLRQGARGPEDLTPPSAPLTLTVGVGVTAILLSFFIPPLVPLSSTIFGFGTGTRIDPTLDLGEDLRRPDPFEVFTLSTEGTAPYVRVATLSRFDGEAWTADQGTLQTLSAGFGTQDWAGDIESTPQRADIDITALSGAWLPVPYAATEVTGLEGHWTAMPQNRTVTTSTADSEGQQYTVFSEQTAPTMEQLTSASARTPDGSAVDIAALPEVIRTTAATVTSAAASDYEKLVTLQDWFRAEFDYSLDAPVEDGFDGNGVAAVERFLDVRAGYCVHFSGAFALMAQTLGMDTRIVVGYLPGQRTGSSDGMTLYSVDSDRLHAWPEVFFEGIGWVPFEPTASLGRPAAFTADAQTGENPEPVEPSEASEETAPTPSSAPDDAQAPTAGPDQQDSPLGAAPAFTLSPWLLLIPGIILVLLIPALLRAALRAWRLERAGRGDVGAAWRELRATLVDLGITVTTSDTPRGRARALVEHGAPEQPVAAVTMAVETASYAPDDPDATELITHTRAVIAGLQHAASPAAQQRARFLPRSLVR